jgi:hypothetical protein
MQENECAAPAANMSARSIPADDVVAKLPFDFIAFFPLYMYVG